MSLQKINQTFDQLKSCNAWSLQLLHARDLEEGFVYNAHTVTVTTPGAIAAFMKELGDAYVQPKGRLSDYQTICDYDGSAAGHTLYRLEVSNPLIHKACKDLLHAMSHPDMKGNALDFKANAYVLKGEISLDEKRVPVKLFTIINPFKVLKHTFMWDGDSFHVLPDKYLTMHRYIDVAMIDNMIYMFNMKGEKLFNMERAYRAICQNKLEDVIASGIVSNEDGFRKYAQSGHNPRKFVSFDENRLQKLRDDIRFKNKMAEKFGIRQTPEGTFDSSDSDNVNRIVKFLCKKGMIDPANDGPVEVEGAKRWR